MTDAPKLRRQAKKPATRKPSAPVVADQPKKTTIRVAPSGPRLKLDGRTESGSFRAAPDSDDLGRWFAEVEACFGTKGDGAMMLLAQTLDAGDGDRTDKMAERGNESLAIIADIAPRDAIEAMLAVQMLGVHRAAMTCLRRAMLADQPFEIADALRKQSGRLLRTYAHQIEALARHRGKGQQKVVVEHVHVYPGGTANVGVVGKDQPASAPPGEGGGVIAINGQIHENHDLSLSARAPMLRHVSADKAALPGAGRKGKSKVPVSRGALGRTIGRA